MGLVLPCYRGSFKIMTTWDYLILNSYSAGFYPSLSFNSWEPWRTNKENRTITNLKTKSRTRSSQDLIKFKGLRPKTKKRPTPRPNQGQDGFVSRLSSQLLIWFLVYPHNCSSLWRWEQFSSLDALPQVHLTSDKSARLYQG